MSDLFDRDDIDFQDTIRKIFDQEQNRDQEDEDEDDNNNITSPSHIMDEDEDEYENEEFEINRPQITHNLMPTSNSNQNLQPSDAINMIRFAVPRPFKSDRKEFETMKQDKEYITKKIDMNSATSVLESCPVCAEMNPKNKHFKTVEEIFAIEHFYRCTIPDHKLFPILVYKHQQLVENECKAMSIPYNKWTISHVRHHFTNCIHSNSRTLIGYFKVIHKVIQDMRKQGGIRSRDNITGNYTYNTRELIQLINIQRSLIADIKKHRKDELGQTIIDAPDGIAVSNMGVSGQRHNLNASTFVSSAVKRRVNMTQNKAPVGSQMLYQHYKHQK